MHKWMHQFNDQRIQTEFNCYISNNFELIYKGYTCLYILLYSMYAIDNLLLKLQYSSQLVGFIRLFQLMLTILIYFIIIKIKAKKLQIYYVFLIEIANFLILIEKIRVEQELDLSNLTYLFHGLSIALQYLLAIFFISYQHLQFFYLIIVLVYIKIRLSILPWNSFSYIIFIAIFSLAGFYLFRRLEMRKFLDFTLNQNELRDIKHILKENFPEGILIFSKRSEKIQNQAQEINIHFINNQFEQFVEINSVSRLSNLRKRNSLVIKTSTESDLKSINIKLIQQQQQSCLSQQAKIMDGNMNFFDFILNIADQGTLEIIQMRTDLQNTENLNNDAESSNSQINQFYKVKFADCIWDRQPSKMLILEDYSQKYKLDQMQLLSQYKDKILATVSHDLKTPINGIIAQIDSIEKSNSQDIINKIFNIVKVNMQLLLYMVYDIQDYSQIQKKKLKIIPKQFNIRKTIEQCIDLIKIQSQIKNLELQYDVQIERYEEVIYNDEIRFKQIILNILSNALKCTVKGMIKVEVKIGKQPNTIQTTIQDTGIGISKENLDKIFNFYYTNLEDEIQHGVGLGLAIAKNLVTLIGPLNRINVESEVGIGSQFSFLIYQDFEKANQQSGKQIIQFNEDKGGEIIPPNLIESSNFILQDLKENNTINTIYQFSKQQLSQQQQQKHQQKSLKFLVVDDDVFCLLAFKSLCSFDKSIKVQVAYNGEEAIKKFLDDKFDAVFTDYNMPIMNGLETLKIIKKHNPQQLVYILSGNNEQNIIDQVIDAGAKQIIRKPLNKETFIDVVNELKTKGSVEKGLIN